MNITLCKNNKYNKKTKEFLERNLPDVKFEEKGCLGECSKCKKGPVARVEGKKFAGKDAYDLLKQIKKSVKITDDKEMSKSENKESSKGDKKLNKIVKKDLKDNSFKLKAVLNDDELYIMLPKKVFEKEDLKLNLISEDEKKEITVKFKKKMEEKISKKK